MANIFLLSEYYIKNAIWKIIYSSKIIFLRRWGVLLKKHDNNSRWKISNFVIYVFPLWFFKFYLVFFSPYLCGFSTTNCWSVPALSRVLGFIRAWQHLSVVFLGRYRYMSAPAPVTITRFSDASHYAINRRKSRFWRTRWCILRNRSISARFAIRIFSTTGIGRTLSSVQKDRYPSRRRVSTSGNFHDVT